MNKIQTRNKLAPSYQVAVLTLLTLLFAGCADNAPPEARIEIAKSREKIDRSLLDKTANLLGADAKSTQLELRVSQQTVPIDVLAGTTPLKLDGNNGHSVNTWITLGERDAAVTFEATPDPRFLEEIGDKLETIARAPGGSQACDLAMAGAVNGQRPADVSKIPYTRDFFSGDLPFDVVETFDAAPATVQQRELAYVIKRWLGLSGDERWRIAETSETMFYFRRAASDLQQATGLVVNTSAEQAPSNVVIRVIGGSRGEQLLELGPPLKSDMVQGAASHHYEFSHWLREPRHGFINASGRVVAKISEIVVQFSTKTAKAADPASPSGKADLTNKSTLRSVSLVARRDSVNGVPVALEVRNNANDERVSTIDLSGIIAPGSVNVSLTKLSLAVLPPRAGNCSLLLRGATMLDQYTGRTPWHIARNVDAVMQRNAFAPETQRPFDGRTFPALDFLSYVNFVSLELQQIASASNGRAPCRNLSDASYAASVTDARIASSVNPASFEAATSTVSASATATTAPITQYANAAGVSFVACGGVTFTNGNAFAKVRQGELQINAPLLRPIQGAELLSLRVTADASQTTPEIKLVANLLNKQGVIIASRVALLNANTSLPSMKDATQVQLVASHAQGRFDIGLQRFEVFTPLQRDTMQSFSQPQPVETASMFRSMQASGNTIKLVADTPIAAPGALKLTVFGDGKSRPPIDRCWLRVVPYWGSQPGEPMQLCDVRENVPHTLTAGEWQQLSNAIAAPLTAVEITTTSSPNNEIVGNQPLRAEALVTGIAWQSPADRYAQLPLVRDAARVQSTLRTELSGIAAIQSGLTTIATPNPGSDFYATTRWLKQLEATKDILNIRSLAIQKGPTTGAPAWLELLHPTPPKSGNGKFILLGMLSALALGAYLLWRHRQHARVLPWRTYIERSLRCAHQCLVAWLPRALDTVAWLGIAIAIAGAALNSTASPAGAVIIALGALIASWFMLSNFIKVSLPIVLAAAVVFSTWAVVFTATQPIKHSFAAVGVLIALTWTSARAVLGTGSTLPVLLWHITWPALVAGLLVALGVAAADPAQSGNRYSWAAIFLTVSLARTLHTAWPWLRDRIPLLRGLGYLEDKGGKYGLVAIAALLLTSLISVINARAAAEHTAMVAYFGLWGLLIHRFWVYRQSRSSNLASASDKPGTL